MIWTADETLHAKEVKPASSVQTEHNYDFQSSNNKYWWAGSVELFTRNWESSSASTLDSMGSMSRLWVVYKIVIVLYWE